MLNVRLDKETEEKLKQYAEEYDMSKTMVVKEALATYLARKDLQKQPFTLGEDLFGVDGSDQSDRSKTYKARLKKKLNAKHSH